MSHQKNNNNKIDTRSQLDKLNWEEAKKTGYTERGVDNDASFTARQNCETDLRQAMVEVAEEAEDNKK
ncbi:hypothetical protein F9B85_10500 [Heliorestis acidaminivorans]|uniref:Uncharacterized protein n=1 Tax=Heliorestis acidaminivorans TaxID=553427 RepID=A0A6I0EVM9_9FIRM|nr:hypothetical protein [Heliorestis acidaminivorans]KAB2951978.1 hypothetical protein F9B85_10500 [Heliorestis acidaminivorans]